MADEMMRLGGDDGIVALPHLHSALGLQRLRGHGADAGGVPEPVRAARAAALQGSALLDQTLEGGAVRLDENAPLSALDSEPSLTLIATRHAEVFRAYDVPPLLPSVAGRWP